MPDITIDETGIYPEMSYAAIMVSAQQKINLERLHIELSALYSSLIH
jgi:hypothetical protein